METEKDTKQTLPDHVLEYIATLCAFDALCNALIEAAGNITEGKNASDFSRKLLRGCMGEYSL